MSNRLAAIESAGRRLIVTTARAVIEKASGFSNYEAGDFLAGRADLLDSHALFEQAADPQPPVGDDSAAEAYPTPLPGHLKPSRSSRPLNFFTAPPPPSS